ncbi:MAG: SBBP repeat-containing protein, partial [Bryobacteraceae bacterium]
IGWWTGSDAQGNGYVAGTTLSLNFPVTPGALQTTTQDAFFTDAFVVKVNPGGTAVLYSTYLAGNQFDDVYGLSVDGAGNAHVAGRTSSTNFPVTAGAFQAQNKSLFTLQDGFLSKIAPTGNSLVFSTYIGGPRDDFANGVTLDPAGNVYITGDTLSDSFPTTPGAYQLVTNDRCCYDGFVSKFSATGSLVWSTMIGSAGNDRAWSIGVDPAGNAYITGQTEGDFPTTPGVVRRVRNGGIDAFVTKFDPLGRRLLYSTFLGGSDTDIGYGIAVDAQGNAHVTGTTTSASFPVVGGAQAAFGGVQDVFVTKVNPDGSAYVYSTFLGGDFADEAFTLAVDGAGNAHIAGSTRSTNFPVSTDALQSTFALGGRDAFVTKLNAAGSARIYSSYLGGAGD